MRLRLKTIAAAGVILASLSVSAAALSQSAWVRQDASGRLVYRQTPTGDRIMDFSYAGYGGGGVALPQVPAVATLGPSGGDDTAAIQAALDRASAAAASDRYGGAVVLRRGVFRTSRPLTLRSGVVLRGEGPGEGQTEVRLGSAAQLAIQVGGNFSEKAEGPAVAVLDSYIPSGARVLRVADTSPFRPGDIVRIVAPVTPAWLEFMGMASLDRNGRRQTWLSGTLKANRTVASAAGGRLTLSAPLSHNYDSRYFGAGGVKVRRIRENGLVQKVGLENLRIVAPASSTPSRQDPTYRGIDILGAQDVFVRNVTILNTTSYIQVRPTARRVTLERVNILNTIPVSARAIPIAISLRGSQILVDRSTMRAEGYTFVGTGSDVQGPNVVLNSRITGKGGISTHQRWATGLLIDGADMPNGSIGIRNRGEMGSGHGWTGAWSVSWNNRTASVLIQNPPGALNWSIGDIGTQARASIPDFGPSKAARAAAPVGIVESSGSPVQPRSLYLEQLDDRLGPAALRAIGYGAAPQPAAARN